MLYIEQCLSNSPRLLRKLTPTERNELRKDGAGMEYDYKHFISGLVALRTGLWDTLPDDESTASALRQEMTTVLHSADEALSQIEALRAWALHSLRTHHGLSHEEIAQLTGTPRATAQSRWRAITKKLPALWNWARYGTTHKEQGPSHP